MVGRDTVTFRFRLDAKEMQRLRMEPIPAPPLAKILSDGCRQAAAAAAARRKRDAGTQVCFFLFRFQIIQSFDSKSRFNTFIRSRLLL